MQQLRYVVAVARTGNFSRAAEQCHVSQPSLSQPIQDERLEVRELFSEELLLALPPGHPRTRKRTVAVADLEGERLIVMKADHCLGDQVLGFCDRRDVMPKISFRSSQLETI
jgi:LysR family transcriptional regulator, hydrogen peroxide-inducible genes activator